MAGAFDLWIIATHADDRRPHNADSDDDDDDETRDKVNEVALQAHKNCLRMRMFNYVVILALCVWIIGYEYGLSDFYLWWKYYFLVIFITHSIFRNWIVPTFAVRVPHTWAPFVLFWATLLVAETGFAINCPCLYSCQTSSSVTTRLHEWLIFLCRSHDSISYVIQFCVRGGVFVVSIVAAAFLHCGCVH